MPTPKKPPTATVLEHFYTVSEAAIRLGLRHRQVDLQLPLRHLDQVELPLWVQQVPHERFDAEPLCRHAREDAG